MAAPARNRVGINFTWDSPSCHETLRPGNRPGRSILCGPPFQTTQVLRLAPPPLPAKPSPVSLPAEQIPPSRDGGAERAYLCSIRMLAQSRAAKDLPPWDVQHTICRYPAKRVFGGGRRARGAATARGGQVALWRSEQWS